MLRRVGCLRSIDFSALFVRASLETDIIGYSIESRAANQQQLLMGHLVLGTKYIPLACAAFAGCMALALSRQATEDPTAGGRTTQQQSNIHRCVVAGTYYAI